MQEQSTPATLPRRGWKRTRMLAGTLALTTGALGAGLAVTALPAYAQVTSNAYTIGSPSGGVTSVSATPTAVTSGAANTAFTVKFTAPAALSGSSSSWISVTPSVALGSDPTSLALTSGSCIQGTTDGAGGGGSDTTTSLVIYLASSCSISAGSAVTITFNATAPTSSFNFSVTTSSNSTAATSNTITVGAGTGVSAANHSFGANTTYTMSNVPIAGLGTSGTTSVTLAATAASGTAIAFSPGTAGYTVTYTPSGGSAATDAVTAVSPTTSAPTVTLTLASAIANGGTLNIVATGTNPAAGTTSNTITVTPVGGTTETAGTITFGNSVTNVTVSPSTLVAGALAQYTVTFKASTAVASGGDINLSETTGPTNFETVTGIAVSDATANWRQVTSTPGTTSGTISIALSNAIAAGDSITITLANVTNPSTTQTVSDFLVSTTDDSVPTAAPPYTIGANGSAGIVVTPNPNTVGSLSTYTISNLKASANMTGGTSTIELSVNGPAGTVFPSSPSSYSVTDSTTGSGSGTVTAAVTGGGTSSVEITVPNSITSGDALSLSIVNVINPSTASSSYTITLTGNVTGPAPVAAFPNANATYPNGAIISFGGTHYVFAGGRAFGIASQSQLASLQKVNHAVIQTATSGATAPTSVTPRAGTLMFTRPINGAATIYVVGTDGELHGFATPKQFGDGGYNGALVVTVTNLGGLTVGDTVGAGGTALNALGTSADGAIVNSSGAYFVFAGGRAFGVPNPTTLNDIRKVNKAQTLTGTVTVAQKSAGFATGTLISVLGPVYVGQSGQLWGFRTQTQLKNLGYGGTAAVTVPSKGGLTVAG